MRIDKIKNLNDALLYWKKDENKREEYIYIYKREKY